jgi:hypothetical protein
MEKQLRTETVGFMPRRLHLYGSPSSYGIRAFVRANERIALELIWAEQERQQKEKTTREDERNGSESSQ